MQYISNVSYWAAKRWKELERDGKRWKEMERDGKRWKEMERDGKGNGWQQEHRQVHSASPPTICHAYVAKCLVQHFSPRDFTFGQQRVAPWVEREGVLRNKDIQRHTKTQEYVPHLSRASWFHPQLQNKIRFSFLDHFSIQAAALRHLTEKLQGIFQERPYHKLQEMKRCGCIWKNILYTHIKTNK